MTTTVGDVTRLEQVTITIDLVDPAPFDLPAIGGFGGTGTRMPTPNDPLRPDEITPYQFTPVRVVVKIEDGQIVDQAAHPGNSNWWWPITDPNGRSVKDGVNREYWPAWLADLVDQTVTAQVS
jgi:hypothetical protein